MANKSSVPLFSVGICVFLLAIFKYHGFILEMAKDIAVMLGLLDQIKSLMNSNFVPIAGISFFIFQAISYTIDIKCGHIKKPYSFLEVFAYISFFPTIMSGPIMRASDFVQQVDHPLTDTASLQEGFLLILSGPFKKWFFPPIFQNILCGRLKPRPKTTLLPLLPWVFTAMRFRFSAIFQATPILPLGWRY